MIKGLKSMLAEVGKIKIGGKGKEVKTKNNVMMRLPEKYDYFVITTTERDANKNFIPDKSIMERIKKNSGQDKIRELRIRLPFDSIDKNFFTEYQYYGGKKKICSGDGEYATRIFTQTGNHVLPFDDGDKEIKVTAGEVVKIKCDPGTCPFYQGNKCKMSGVLSAFLPDADDLGGVYKFRTHGYHSVSSIASALEYFAENTGGILQGMPLKLIMINKATEEFGTIYVVAVVIDKIELHQLRDAARKEVESRNLLGVNIGSYESKVEQSGFFKDHDPEDEIQEEFYPDTNNIKNVTPKGTTSEDIKEKLQEKKAPDPKPEPAKKPEEQDGLF